MVYLYTLALILSAGLFGVFCRSVLTGLVFVPDLESGVLILAASGLFYASGQCFYMLVLRLLWPTKTISLYVSEIGSFCATAALLPYILHVEVNWPHPVLERVEPLLYLAGFLVIHLVMKLSTFYASLQGLPTGRLGALGYSTVAMLCLAGGLHAENRWVESLEAARVVVGQETESMIVGSYYADARKMTEGATYTQESLSFTGQTVTTRWSKSPASDIERVYATFVMQGDKEKVYQGSTSVRHDSWSEIRVPNEFVPEGMHTVQVRWTSQKEPNWQRILGLRPIVYNISDEPYSEPAAQKTVWMSGPDQHLERPLTRNPSIILIMVDGLAANHISMMGYARNVTPSIDRLAYGGLSFPNMFSSSEDVFEATEDLLVGNLGSTSVIDSFVTTLADAGYSTIGYTEGDGPGGVDLAYGSGVEPGFALFDMSFDRASSSALTLQKARLWIEEHQEIAFFMLLRLRALEDISVLQEIEGTYPEAGNKTDVDAFDNGLSILDGQLGSLLKYIRDHETRKNTYVILTSTYGHAFLVHSDGRRLEEPTLRVPLIVSGPGVRKTKMSTRVETDDLRATISGITGVAFEGAGGGRSVL